MQHDLQRLVGGRHGVGAKLIGLHPDKLLALMRDNLALPAPAKIERHQQMKIGISMAGEGEREKIGGRHLE